MSPAAGAVRWACRRRYSQGTHSVRDSLTAYDTAGRVSAVTDANGQVTQTIYDAVGQVAYIVDAFGGRTATAYDRRGQAIRTVYPDGTENPSRHLCD
ncbi:MAG TPA: hypothetical protein VF595_09025 [Tepidisphaeraceae bacterium]